MILIGPESSPDQKTLFEMPVTFKVCCSHGVMLCSLKKSWTTLLFDRFSSDRPNYGVKWIKRTFQNSLQTHMSNRITLSTLNFFGSDFRTTGVKFAEFIHWTFWLLFALFFASIFHLSCRINRLYNPKKHFVAMIFFFVCSKYCKMINFLTLSGVENRKI